MRQRGSIGTGAAMALSSTEPSAGPSAVGNSQVKAGNSTTNTPSSPPLNDEDMEDGEISDEGEESVTPIAAAQQVGAQRRDGVSSNSETSRVADLPPLPTVRWLTPLKDALHIWEPSGNSLNSREVVLGQCTLNELKQLSVVIGASAISGNCNHKQTWVATITAHVDALGLDPVRKAAIPLRFTLPGRTRRPLDTTMLVTAEVNPTLQEEPRQPSPACFSPVEVERTTAGGSRSADPVDLAPVMPTATIEPSLGEQAPVPTEGTKTRKPRRSRFTYAPSAAPAVDLTAVPASAATITTSETKAAPQNKPAELVGPPHGRQHGTVHRVKPDGSGTIFQTKLSEKLPFQTSAVLGEIFDDLPANIADAAAAGKAVAKEPTQGDLLDASLPPGIKPFASPKQRLRRGDKVSYRIVSEEAKTKGSLKWVAVDIVRTVQGVNTTVKAPETISSAAVPLASMRGPPPPPPLPPPGLAPILHGVGPPRPPPYAPFPSAPIHGRPHVQLPAHGQHGMPLPPKPPQPPPHPLGQGASMPNDVHPPGSHLRNERPVNTVGQQTNVRLSSDMSRESRAALERAVMQELEEVRAQFLNIEPSAPPNIRPSVAAAVAAAVNVKRANPQPPSLPLPLPQPPQVSSLPPPPHPSQQPKPPPLPPPPPPLPLQHPPALSLSPPPPPHPSQVPKPPPLLPPQQPQASPLPSPSAKHPLPPLPLPVFNPSTAPQSAPQSSVVKPSRVRRRSRFQDAVKVDASSTANGNLSNSVVGTKDLAARAPEDGSIVGGGSTGSNRKARGATNDQDFDMEIDDEKGLFSVEANITDRTAGAKEDRQIGVSSSDVYNGESREAVDNHHLDMEIDDEDNIKKVILSRDGNIAVGGICSNVSKGETRRVPDNQDLDMDIDVGARLNHGEEASMPAEEAITAESKRALATSAEDEASTSMTPSVKEPISQLSAEPSQEDKLRAEVLKSLSSNKNSVPPKPKPRQEMGLHSEGLAPNSVRFNTAAASTASESAVTSPKSVDPLSRDVAEPNVRNEAILAAAILMPPPPPSVADHLNDGLPAENPPQQLDSTSTIELRMPLPAVTDKFDMEVFNASETPLTAPSPLPGQLQPDENERRLAAKNEASQREQALRAAVLQSFAKSKKKASTTTASSTSSQISVNGAPNSITAEPPAEPIGETAAEPGSVDDIAAFLNAHTSKWQAQVATKAQVKAANKGDAEAVAAVETEAIADEEEKSRAGSTSGGETLDGATTITTTTTAALIGQSLVHAPSATSSLSDLKAFATKLGITSPKGNKSKKATWVKAIEHKLRQQSPKRQLVVANRVQQPRQPSARTPPPLSANPNTTAAASLTRASLSTSTLAVTSGQQHQQPAALMPQHLKAYIQCPSLTISDDDEDENEDSNDEESDDENTESGSLKRITLPTARVIVRHGVGATATVAQSGSTKKSNSSTTSLRGSASLVGKKRPAAQSLERSGTTSMKTSSMLPSATARAASAASAAVAANAAQVSAAEQSAADDRLLAMTNEIARMKQLITMREAAKREVAVVGGGGTSSSSATRQAPSPPQEGAQALPNKLLAQKQEEKQIVLEGQDEGAEVPGQSQTVAAVYFVAAVEEEGKEEANTGANAEAESLPCAEDGVELKESSVGKKRKADDGSTRSLKSVAKDSDLSTRKHLMSSREATATVGATAGAADDANTALSKNASVDSVGASATSANTSLITSGAAARAPLPPPAAAITTTAGDDVAADIQGRVVIDSDSSSSSSAIASIANNNASASSRERLQSLASRQGNLRFIMEAARDFKAIEAFAQRVTQSRIQLQHAEVSELSSGVGKLRQERDSVLANCLDASSKRLRSLIQVVTARRNAATNVAHGSSTNCSSATLAAPPAPNRKAATNNTSRLK